MGWAYTFKKESTRYGRKVPARVEARKKFDSDGVHAADVLIVAFEDGSSTISMNGTARIKRGDFLDMAQAVDYTESRLRAELQLAVAGKKVKQ